MSERQGGGWLSERCGGRGCERRWAGLMWWSLYSCSLYTLLSGYATAVVGGGWNAVGPTPLAEEDEELSYRGMCAWVGRVRHRRFLCTEARVKYTGPWRVMRPTFLSDTCWPHLWPKSKQTADLVVALLILHRKTCSDFPNSIPVAFCAIGRLHPAWPPNAHGAPRWSCIEARLHQMLEKCC